MNPIFSRTLKALCSLTAVAMLSACGGASSTVDPFVATRVIAFGDGFNYVDGAGAGLSTVQTGETDNTIAGRVAARYGIVVKDVQSNALAATGGFSYATANAKVSDVATQINAFLTSAGGTVAKKDMIIIAVGNWDIKANIEGTATDTIDTATTNLVTAIQRLTAAGAALAFGLARVSVLGYRMVSIEAFLLVPAQDYVGAFLATFRDYPQRQKASSFNMEEVFKNLSEGASR